jgi:NTE family protein
MIEMSAELANSLNYESKLDRSPANIQLLIADGKNRENSF